MPRPTLHNMTKQTPGARFPVTLKAWTSPAQQWMQNPGAAAVNNRFVSSGPPAPGG